MQLEKELCIAINAARTLGKIRLTDAQLYALCLVILSDLGRRDLITGKSAPTELLGGDYFSIPIKEFEIELPEDFNFETEFKLFARNVPDFISYFKCLCELHKRRLKFQEILKFQCFPEIEQIVPRSILEYKFTSDEALASWLVWRKWLYDIDNRAAQETGYMFEPILTAAIGGVSFSAEKSPIRRSDETKGRQVDCIEGKDAYEFKMRVTIAPSGKGRFREELKFARDCKQSGFRPILVVLDPTPSPRLKDLVIEYKKFGGLSYVGKDAWKHLEEKAGPAMATFIDKYVKKPIFEVSKAYPKLLPISFDVKPSRVLIRAGRHKYAIPRLG